MVTWRAWHARARWWRVFVAVAAILLVAGTAGVVLVREVLRSPELEDPAGAAVEQNLKTWRFRPGPQVFIHESSRRILYVALTATDSGRLYLGWIESGKPETSLVLVSGSPTGQWQREAERTLTGEERGGGPLAVAANSSGEVALLWYTPEKAWAWTRDAAGNWDQPVALPGRATYSIGLAPHPDGGFEALVGQEYPGGPGVKRFRKPPRSPWRETTMPASGGGGSVSSDVSQWGTILGLRGGPVGVSRGELVNLDTGATVGKLPDARTAATYAWIRSQGRAAIITASKTPVREAMCVQFSEDLQTWTAPAFLGWRDPVRLTTAVAAVGQDVYVATNFQPYHDWAVKVRPPKGLEAESAVRVFRLDDSLTRDSDGDGLTDLTEEWLLTDPNQADTDRDGQRDATDLNPLAGGTPLTEEAQVRRAAFRRLARGEIEKNFLVIVPRRQVFAHRIGQALCLTHEEARLYRAKCGPWALPWVEFSDISTTLGGLHATVDWTVAIGDLGAGGGRAHLVRVFGSWLVVARGQQWIS